MTVNAPGAIVAAGTMICGLRAPASGEPVHGVVFADLDGDGALDPGEPGVPGAVVGAELVEVITDDRGRFDLDAPFGAPVWVRTFDGFALGPVWQPAQSRVELALAPAPVVAGPVRFVAAADTHIGRTPEDGDVLAAALAQAMAVDGVRLVMIAGDLTQGGTEDQFDALDAAADAAGASLLRVAGNHDLTEDGAIWRDRYGPDVYSVDVGNVHFLVLDGLRPAADLVAFVTADLATVSPDATVVVCTHGPPERDLAEPLAGLHVDLVLAGHWHLNRTIHRDRYLELDTEPLIMGGMGPVAAGFRVITIDDGGAIAVDHHTVTAQPVLAVASPRDGMCVAPRAPFEVVVAAAPAGAVTAAIGDTIVPLAPAGGWLWRGRLPAPSAGTHAIRITADARTLDATITVCDRAPSPARPGEWTQLGGDPARTGVAPGLPADLALQWVTPVGGSLLAGCPVIGHDTVFVAALDLATDDASAIVALDLADGHQRWRVPTGSGARNGLAVAGDVVIASLVDGRVLGLDADTGAERWQVDLGAGVLPEQSMTLGAPLVIGARALVGNQRRFAAIDTRTGTIVWERDLVPHSDGAGSYVPPALVAGRVIALPKPWIQGFMDLDPDTGDNTWTNLTTCASSASAAPVAHGDKAIVIAGSTEICELDPATGDAFLVTTLDATGFDWGYAVSGTPAIDGDMLYVATHYGGIYAVDLADSAVRWHVQLPATSPVLGIHYRASGDPVMGSPVVAGDLVWVGTADGRIVGLAKLDGQIAVELPVGAPILSGLAPAGDWLIAAGYDGGVRAFAPSGHSRPPGRVAVTAVAVLGGALVALGVALGVARRAALRRQRAVAR